MMNSNLKLSVISIAIVSQFALAGSASAFDGLTDKDSLQIKNRTVFFDREYADAPQNDSNTLAQGLELNYQSGVIADWFKIGLSAYGVANINSTGTANKPGILPKDPNDKNNVDSAFGKVGQAYIELLPSDAAAVKVGYQKTKQMLIGSSGSRAIPNTFRGITASYQLNAIKLYGYAFDEWSARNSDDWDGFGNGDGEQIDLIWGLGAKYKQGKFAADVEYLVSEDYLEKFGVRGSYSEALAGGKLKLSGGYFTSADNGYLFENNGDSNLDGITSNDGSVWYLDADFKYQAFSVGLAFSQTDEIWIEDNFKGDHGTNPLPTRAPIGPDMTNANESVWLARIGVDFGALSPTFKGLTTKISYADGSDAENAADASLGQADEQFFAIDTRYSVPAIKGLKLRYLYVDYRSDETGKVGGVKGDNTDHRIYVDYAFKF